MEENTKILGYFFRISLIALVTGASGFLAGHIIF